MIELTQEIVRELIKYNPSTGECWWKERDIKWFRDDARWTADQNCRKWNTLYSEKPCFTANKDGYKVGAIFCINYRLHRIIWLYMTGEWPDIVDHINGIRNDNRWCNLRNVDDNENSKNLALNKNNTSGKSGVGYVKRLGRWRARIFHENKEISLGGFSTKEEAIEARKTS